MAISSCGTAYELIGHAGAPTVVLIHGLGLNRLVTWGSIVDTLAENFLVIRYDLCGHGDTVLPEDRVDLSRLGKQLIDLLDELHIDTAALVGFSLGGMINRRCAMDYHERVSSLVILNSPHERGDAEQKRVEERARDTSAGGPAANINATLARWFTADFRANHPDQVETIRRVVLANHPANYAAHRRVLAEGVKELIRPNPPITQPTLVITCENDSGSTPAMTQAIAEEIPDADSLIIPELQHLGLIEHPEIFADNILSFLQKQLL